MRSSKLIKKIFSKIGSDSHSGRVEASLPSIQRSHTILVWSGILNTLKPFKFINERIFQNLLNNHTEDVNQGFRCKTKERKCPSSYRKF